MKKIILLALFVMAIGFNSYSQFSFGVAPGIATNSAYFGYKADKVVPYVALQILNGSFKRDYTDRYFEGPDWVTDKSNMKGNVNIIVPTLGVKFFAIETGNLKAYLNLSGSKPFISGKMKEDDIENEDFADAIKKVKLMGAELGFGVEYFLSSNFSVGGEYALRYLSGNFTEKDEYEHNSRPAVETTKYTLNIIPTVAKFTLNYYFGGE